MARPTKIIAVVNPKGGCGKTTIATSLAAWLAYEHSVALVDMDLQQSASDWLQLRIADNPQVHQARSKPWPPEAAVDVEYLVIDAPAGINGQQLTRLLTFSDKFLVPLLPSPIDMRAGWRFLDELLKLRRDQRANCQIGLVANRVKTWTLIYRELTGFIGQFKAPFVTHLRESVNYIRAAEAGLGVAELPYYQCQRDWQEWEPLIAWVKA